jgi:tetratricopeptide (TPR) repeat protein
LVGFNLTSKNADDILEELYQLNAEHKITEAIELAEKAIVRYPYNTKLLKRAGTLYKIMWIQSQDDSYRQRALELFERALSTVVNLDENMTDEIEIRKEIALLQKDKKNSIKMLKGININGTFNDLMGELLFESGEVKEGLDCYDKMLHISVLEISNVTGHMIEYLTREKKYKECIDQIDWTSSIYKGMLKPNAISFGYRWMALAGAIKAVCYELINEHEKMKNAMEEALQAAKDFDKNPVYDIYSGNKFVYGPMDDKPVAWDTRANDSQTEIRAIVEELLENEGEKFNKKELDKISEALDYLNLILSEE